MRTLTRQEHDIVTRSLKRVSRVHSQPLSHSPTLTLSLHMEQLYFGQQAAAKPAGGEGSAQGWSTPSYLAAEGVQVNNTPGTLLTVVLYLIVTHILGSSAGAGSGEFHVYRAQRRKEIERLKDMEAEAKEERAQADFELKRYALHSK